MSDRLTVWFQGGVLAALVLVLFKYTSWQEVAMLFGTFALACGAMAYCISNSFFRKPCLLGQEEDGVGSGDEGLSEVEDSMWEM